MLIVATWLRTAADDRRRDAEIAVVALADCPAARAASTAGVCAAAGTASSAMPR